MKTREYKVGGYTLQLREIYFGIHSDETIDYRADLYANGKRIASVENDGRGGATNYCYDPANKEMAMDVDKAVRAIVWLVCCNGRELHHDIGTISDELLERDMA